jgi:hypothetical protein
MTNRSQVLLAPLQEGTLLIHDKHAKVFWQNEKPDGGQGLKREHAGGISSELADDVSYGEAAQGDR